MRSGKISAADAAASYRRIVALKHKLGLADGDRPWLRPLQFARELRPARPVGVSALGVPRFIGR